MEPLKDQLLPVSFFKELGDKIASVTSFNKEVFAKKCEIEIPKRELKDRLKYGVELMHELFQLDYLEVLGVFEKVAPTIENSFSGIIFPTYIEYYGLENREESLKAIHFLTRFSTGEFAIRPYLEQDLPGTLALMLVWSKDENEHVRRLASEGCRPKLPWAPQVTGLRKDPTLTIEILENLKEDDSLYVRKSVGNHLNDLSKDHPEWLCERLLDWDQTNSHTKWILGKGIRSLIKDAYAPAFALAGFEKDPRYQIQKLAVEDTELKIGEETYFSFDIASQKEQYLNVDFIVEYQKKNGRSKKVFKLSTLNLKQGEVQAFRKKLSFKQLSTRKHYPGKHTISVLVNGVESDGVSVDLE